VLSNNIKHEGFFPAVSVISDGYSRMAVTLSNPRGERCVIFDRFAVETGTSTSYLVDTYSNWCEERILHCPERDGAERVIPTLRAAGNKVHVKSVTLAAPLRSIVSRRFGMDFFDGVHGEKVGNLKTTLALEAIPPEELVMVGDGADDWDAANRFVSVPDGTLASVANDGLLVGDFDDLWPHLLNGSDDE